MACIRGAVGGFAWILCALGSGQLSAQGAYTHPSAKNWAWDQVKAISVTQRDPVSGRSRSVGFLQLSPGEQKERLMAALRSGSRERRAALLVLSDRPADQWASQALKLAPDPAEVGLLLQAKGYRSPGAEPLAHLGDPNRLDRPWTHGLGLHFEGKNWRLQWIPSPSLLPKREGGTPLPSALEAAPQPGALLHLRRLLPGLRQLRELAGGDSGILPALAQGSRMGFLARHLEPWFAQASPVLGPLADREAWVLHFGMGREEGPSGGTLLFLPGDLPTRTKLALELLKLNPSSRGARSRGVTLEGPGGAKAEISQVRGSGGVLHLWATGEGTWICDRESTLKALIFPGTAVTLGERAEWGRIARGAEMPETTLSLWVLPRIGADARFEAQALRRRLQGLGQQTWTNPHVAKAAPRGSTLSLSLGAGPTEQLLLALLRVDRSGDLVEPKAPAFSNGGQLLTAEQQREFQTQLNSIRKRNSAKRALRDDLAGLLPLLDLRGATLSWQGWTPPPPLDAREKKALTEFRRLQKESPRAAARLQQEQGVSFFGGFGEPGMTPAMALALPIQSGRQAAVESQMRKLWPRLFEGEAQKRVVTGTTLFRVRTSQAFAPSYALSKDHLVLASDDQSLQTVVEGLQGRMPTLADLPPGGYGRGELDGPRLAHDLETLLQAYLRANKGGYFDGLEPAAQDETGAELAATFGPFLGALKGLGRRSVQLEFGPGGLEIRPQ